MQLLEQGAQAKDAGGLGWHWILKFAGDLGITGEVTCQFLEWVTAQVSQMGKRVMPLIWDNASWHVSKQVRQWIRQHNAQVQRTGKGVRLIVCQLPVKSPWLNAIEPKWIHAKRAIVEPQRKLSAQELKTRVCDYFECPLLEPLAKKVS